MKKGNNRIKCPKQAAVTTEVFFSNLKSACLPNPLYIGNPKCDSVQPVVYRGHPTS